MKIFMRYRFSVVSVFILTLIIFFDQKIGMRAAQLAISSFREMALIIPPIFILLGLLDSWISREVMMRLMGDDSGLKGIALAFFLGSAAAGPLYGAFPVAGVFMKKGVSLLNVLIFIGAWSSTKIPMLLFELSSLGAPFTLTRLAVNIPGIILIALILSKITRKKDIENLYEKARLF
ncbi:MAG: permease [Dehalobacter sp. 4CP]|nr:permease [Dehalobacter sp. 4CP]